MKPSKPLPKFPVPIAAGADLGWKVPLVRSVPNAAVSWILGSGSKRSIESAESFALGISRGSMS